MLTEITEILSHKYSNIPMDKSSSIRYSLDIKFLRRIVVDISLIMKRESKWKEWRRFDFQNRWNINEFPRAFFDVVSMSNPRYF